LTLKINRVPDSPKDYACTKFGQNPLKDVDPRVFTRMVWKDGWTEGRYRYYIPSQLLWRGDTQVSGGGNLINFYLVTSL
jgi:hypothetical protein